MMRYCVRVQTELLDKELSVPVVLKAYLHPEAPCVWKPG